MFVLMFVPHPVVFCNHVHFAIFQKDNLFCCCTNFTNFTASSLSSYVNLTVFKRSTQFEMDETASVTWKIDNFKYVDSYKHTFGQFKISFKNDIFYLGLEPTDKVDFLENQTVISLLRTEPYETDVSVLWKIALIDKNGVKCHSKDIETSFEASDGFSNHPISGGMYHLDRDIILDPSNGLLPNGKLVIQCQLTDIEYSKPQIACQNFVAANVKALEDYGSLLESSKHSDVVFVLGGKQFKVHKAILSARSPVFCAMFDTDLEESKKKQVEITDVDVEVFEELLRFIYGGKVEAMEQYAEDLLVLSDKYQLESLKHLCEQSLSNNLTVQTVTRVLTLADMHHAAELKSNCIEFITSNATQVTATEGWKLLAKDLLMELYRDMMLVKCDKK